MSPHHVARPPAR